LKKPLVLLTGAAGRLGSVIREDLADVWEIIPVSRKPGALQFDLLRQEDRRAVLENKFDIVVNTAAVSSPGQCAKHPRQGWILNTLWPLELARHCLNTGIRVVNFSSDLVYSGGTPPYREPSPAVPMSFYGWTKLAADILVQKANQQVLTVRTSVLCGETSSHRTTFSQEILTGSINRVFVDSWRNHTPIHWLAGLLPELLKKEEKGLVIASGRYCQSRSSYAETLLRKNGRSTEHLLYEYSPPGIPSRLQLEGRYSTESVFE
jgi:dTDP-4-dehydrorhamnose reductase